MILTLDEYRCKLLNKILHSYSEYEVQRFIVTAMKSLQSNKVHGHIILRFLKKSIMNLERLEHKNDSSRKWKNICYARDQFNYLIKSQEMDYGHIN